MMRLSLIRKSSSSVLRSACTNENGAVLVIGLTFLAIIALLGSTAVLMTTTDLKIGANYKTSVQAFNAAQAGIEEARARMRANATNPITDGDPTNPNWETYIVGKDASLVQNFKDYSAGDSTAECKHGFTDIDYAVQIKHALDASGNVLYWGDSNGDGILDRNTTGDGNNIYLTTCYGTASGGVRAITLEITRVPPVNVPAALYVEDGVDINSAHAEVDGNDQCGGSTNLPGVATTKPQVSATAPVNDHHGSITGTGTPAVDYNAPVLDIQSIIDTYKSMADYSITPGNYSWQNWGTPTGTPATPDCAESNIVYASGDIKVTKSTGCGILLVDGDLDVQAGFQWYGMVFVSGCLKYTGNAASDGIYGAVLCKGTGCTSNDITGNVKLHYCSAAVNNAIQNMPLHVLSWKDDF